MNLWGILANLERRQLVLAAGAVGAVVALIGAFELGQWRAGYSTVRAQVAERRLGRELEALQTENRQAEEQLAHLKTDEKVDREAYAQVESQLAELQGKIIEQQEELAFYRGIMSGPGQGGLRVQDFALTAVAAGVHVGFVLSQAERAAREVRGQLQMRVEGIRDGRLASIDLASLAVPPGTVPLSFGFRYFHDVAADVRVPGDFKPQRVVIRILPSTKGVKGSVESFPWSVRGG